MPTAKQAPDTLVVLASFVGRVGSEERFFRQGELVHATDPAVRKWPEFFGPPTFNTEPRIEQATAAPGEKRGA